MIWKIKEKAAAMDNNLRNRRCYNCAQMTPAGCALPEAVKKTKVRRKLLRRGYCNLWEENRKTSEAAGSGALVYSWRTA